MRFKPGDRIVSVTDEGTDIDIGEEFIVIEFAQNYGKDMVTFTDRDGFGRIRRAKDYQLAEIYRVVRLLEEYECTSD
jgi:hypothetical protein